MVETAEEGVVGSHCEQREEAIINVREDRKDLIREKTLLCLDEEEEESDTDVEEDEEGLTAKRYASWYAENVDKYRSVGDDQRAQFLQTVTLQPPHVFRVIDIETTCTKGIVTLLDYHHNGQISATGYSAISHTYGMEVYNIFDCRCAAEFKFSSNEGTPPRCWDRPCSHITAGEHKDKRDRIVGDILQMCHILWKAGVKYAWHDGVCIAQHDEDEVRATIQSMGWVYSSANETIIFLHYVGKPMAPISLPDSGYDLVCRWHTRVWTLQEAALSKNRRYCVRVCRHRLQFYGYYRSCKTLKKLMRKLKEFEETVAQWYNIGTSQIDVITEERFLTDFLYQAEDASRQLWLTLMRLKKNKSILWNGTSEDLGLEDWYSRMYRWSSCLNTLKSTVQSTCLGFPTFGEALAACSKRDSKHIGDRINSILVLARLNNFTAPKEFSGGDDTMENWTIEFFKQIGMQGLVWALFSVNVGVSDDVQPPVTRSWVPLLWKVLREPEIVGISECINTWDMKLKVTEDRMLQINGEFLCVAVTFVVNLKEGKTVAKEEHVTQRRGVPMVADMDQGSLASMNPSENYGSETEDFYTEQGSLACISSGENIASGDEESLADDCTAETDEALEVIDKGFADEAESDDTYINLGSNIEICVDNSALEREQYSEGEMDEEECETDDEELEEIIEQVKVMQNLNLELNLGVDGFGQSFFVRLLGTNILIGAVTFISKQPGVGDDGIRINGSTIEEGSSFDAFLLIPLHCELKTEFLIVNGNLSSYVFKIGAMTMFRELDKMFYFDGATNHPAYKIVKEICIS
ncbi:hypothetical protein KP509_05G028700 [Ceratopteris richardii]|uniref:Heterokaryon incompatibility domain-containing protein n=1 Tax=Ceratopteris richardii TaxID=49495 RepID=A0A8T2US65_CERRI|nr:hypothetical protein KP509_05G028700 [Ceratopteris richardii]